MKKLTPFQKRILTAVLIISLSISGYLLSKFVESQMRRSEFSNLLLKTQMIALLINAEDVQSLSADESDIDKPVYVSLKKKLIEVKKIDNDIQYLYLLGLDENNQQFFYAGSELMNSEYYTAPGTLNDQAGAKDIRDYMAGATHVSVRTDSDDNQSVSAYAPIRSDDGEVVAVVRMDVDAQKMMLLINIIRRGILLITALVVFSLMLIYINGSRKLS